MSHIIKWLEFVDLAARRPLKEPVKYFRREAPKVWKKELTVGSVRGYQRGGHNVKSMWEMSWLNVWDQAKSWASVYDELIALFRSQLDLKSWWILAYPCRTTAEPSAEMSQFTVLLLGYLSFLISTAFSSCLCLISSQNSTLHHCCELTSHFWALSVVWTLARHAIATL